MKYLVENTQSGTVLGAYEAETPEEALELCSRDAGYETHKEACKIAPDGDLIARPLGEPRKVAGPGKFGGELEITRELWKFGEFDGEVMIGGSASFAYVERPFVFEAGFEITREEEDLLRETVAILFHERSDGFVCATYYEDEKVFRRDWEICERAEGARDDVDEYRADELAEKRAIDELYEPPTFPPAPENAPLLEKREGSE